MTTQTQVKELMSGDPISVGVEASALEAYEAMLRHGIRHLPVLGAGRRVVGVITADDLAAALALPLRPREPLSGAERRAALEYGVGELMTHAPRTLDRDATVAEAAEQMAEGRFGCLPIVDEKGRLEGMLTETDLLYALSAQAAGAPSRQRRKQDALAALVAELESERARIAKMDMVKLTSSLDALAAKRLAALDRALDPSRRGSLSVCDSCGGPISLPRLRALPGTTLCIDCARAAEGG